MYIPSAWMSSSKKCLTESKRSMEQTFKIEMKDKKERYEAFLPMFSALIKDEEDEVTLLANASAAFKEAFDFFWVGFYMVRDGILHLGPFQGTVACTRIQKGKGVCGKAWQEGKTQIVEDVNKIPYHIACSSASRSEIVVPLFKDGQVAGVLDIDSDRVADFDETDGQYLEKAAEIISLELWHH